jgi:uncharacterized protein (TIGR00251 family)
VSEQGLRISETGGALTLSLHIQPRAKRTELAGLHGNSLKLRVAAPAIENAANRAAIDFLAASLGVKRADVRIVSGAKSREKVLRIQGASLARFRETFPSLL